MTRDLFCALFLLWIAIATLDRLCWIYAGEGLQGFVDVADYREAGIVSTAAIAEIKWKEGSNHGVMLYRSALAGNGPALWPLYHEVESAQLARYAQRLGAPGGIASPYDRVRWYLSPIQSRQRSTHERDEQ